MRGCKGGANDDTSFVEDFSNANTSVACKPGLVNHGSEASAFCPLHYPATFVIVSFILIDIKVNVDPLVIPVHQIIATQTVEVAFHLLLMISPSFLFFRLLCSIFVAIHMFTGLCSEAQDMLVM